MPAFKKRKLDAGAAPSGSAQPKVKLAKSSRSTSNKPVAKPAPPPASESESDEDDEVSEEEQEPTVQNGEDTAADSSKGENAPSSDEPKKTFADLGVREELCDACENLKFTHPTPIQTQAIPLALEGRDVIGLAETGSGKTAAFVLPILQSLLEKPQALFGLILAPTRELAYQISQQVDALGSIINVKCATLVGGMDMVPQAIALSKRPHIVVATPG